MLPSLALESILVFRHVRSASTDANACVEGLLARNDIPDEITSEGKANDE